MWTIDPQGAALHAPTAAGTALRLGDGSRERRVRPASGDGLLTVGGEEPAIYQQMLANFEQGARKAGKYREAASQHRANGWLRERFAG